MKWTFSFLLLMVLASVALAKVYKWTDNQGNVHFSDKPHRGAVEIDLPPVQTYSPPEIPQPTDETPDAADEDGDTYEEVVILQPENGATIRNNQGLIPVQAKTVPELREGDQLQLIFDGQKMGSPQKLPSFTLNNVFRGTHTIAIQVIDAEGKELKTSDTVTVHMHRPRVGMVPQTRPQNQPLPLNPPSPR